MSIINNLDKIEKDIDLSINKIISYDLKNESKKNEQKKQRLTSDEKINELINSIINKDVSYFKENYEKCRNLFNLTKFNNLLKTLTENFNDDIFDFIFKIEEEEKKPINKNIFLSDLLNNYFLKEDFILKNLHQVSLVKKIIDIQDNKKDCSFLSMLLYSLYKLEIRGKSSKDVKKHLISKSKNLYNYDFFVNSLLDSELSFKEIEHLDGDVPNYFYYGRNLGYLNLKDLKKVVTTLNKNVKFKNNYYNFMEKSSNNLNLLTEELQKNLVSKGGDFYEFDNINFNYLSFDDLKTKVLDLMHIPKIKKIIDENGINVKKSDFSLNQQIIYSILNNLDLNTQKTEEMLKDFVFLLEIKNRRYENIYRYSKKVDFYACDKEGNSLVNLILFNILSLVNPDLAIKFIEKNKIDVSKIDKKGNTPYKIFMMYENILVNKNKEKLNELFKKSLLKEVKQDLKENNIKTSKTKKRKM